VGTLGGSASDALAPVLGAPRQRACVVGAGPVATYLLADSGDVLAIVSCAAVRVPCAVMLGAGTPVPAALHPGASAWVGDGAVGWAGGQVRVRRWWAAATVGTGSWSPRRTQQLAERLRDHHLPPGVAPVLHAAARCLQDGDGAAAGNHLVTVLGLGPGLTPSADDAVAGLLLAARAAAGAVADLPGALVARAAPARTTAVSAALLAHAAAGRAAPQVVGAVEALAGRGDLGPALDALWALGHSSGADTAAGILAAIRGDRTVRRVA